MPTEPNAPKTPAADTASTPEAPAAKTFIADEPLFIGRARAYNKGDEVQAKHVRKHGWADKVHQA